MLLVKAQLLAMLVNIYDRSSFFFHLSIYFVEDLLLASSVSSVKVVGILKICRLMISMLFLLIFSAFVPKSQNSDVNVDLTIHFHRVYQSKVDPIPNF